MSRAECSAEDCTAPAHGRGLCDRHYYQWRKASSVEDRGTGRRGPVGKRLHDPGEHNYTRLETPCREWLGLRVPKGYGVYKGRSIHRWIWETIHGPIPPGMVIMHRCDNPPCYRLDHLRLGTIGDNQRDMVAKGRAGNRYITRLKERT